MTTTAGDRARERARQRLLERRRREAQQAPARARREAEDAALWELFVAGRRVPEPTRITCALDLRMLDGPQVDRDCGTQEPAVDEWEAGTRVPTPDQLLLLAEPTDMPWAFFFGERMPELVGVTLCWSTRQDAVSCGRPTPDPDPGQLDLLTDL